MVRNSNPINNLCCWKYFIWPLCPQGLLWRRNDAEVETAIEDDNLYHYFLYHLILCRQNLVSYSTGRNDDVSCHHASLVAAKKRHQWLNMRAKRKILQAKGLEKETKRLPRRTMIKSFRLISSLHDLSTDV